MPGFLLHAAASLKCFHGAGAAVVPSQVRVLVGGQPVATMDSKIGVVGCPFQVPVGTATKPQPCVQIRWVLPSTRFLVGGKPAALVPALGPGPGVCESVEKIPQGAPIVGAVQLRVVGS
jgi:hypothetical protein